MDMPGPQFDPASLLTDGRARVRRLTDNLRRYRQDLGAEIRHLSQDDIASGLAALDGAITAAERARRALDSAANTIEEDHD